MTTAESRGTSTESTIELATGRVRVQSGGTGAALVVVGHDTGSPGWEPLFEALAQRFAVQVPDMPGYGKSDRPEWARHPRDIAILLNMLLDHQGLDRVTLVGLGFGGWVAAEMATMNQRRLSSLVLVGPFGVKPEEGQLADQMMMGHIDYVKLGFKTDEDFDAKYGAEVDPELALQWDLNKEMTARIAWKPNMFSLQLPSLLRGVSTPTLLVWGVTTASRRWSAARSTPR